MTTAKAPQHALLNVSQITPPQAPLYVLTRGRCTSRKCTNRNHQIVAFIPWNHCATLWIDACSHIPYTTIRHCRNPALYDLEAFIVYHCDIPFDQVAIPLYDTNGTNCAGKPCSQTIVEQPFNPFALNSRYAARASGLIAEHAQSNREHIAGGTGKQPMFLYVAFAHTHTPLAYEPAFENASSRPGELKVFGNTLAEVISSVLTCLVVLVLGAPFPSLSN